MTDTVDTSKEAVERIKGSIYFGADWCQWHPDYYEGFTGPVDKIDTSHGLSVVMGGERTKAGDLAGADMAGYLQDCANMVPKLLAERDQLRREVEEARDKALEEAQNVVLQQIGEDKNGFRIWADERPYVCEETVYRSIRALKARP